MATPFIAGAVAALLSARASENLTPSQVRSILSSTAKLVSTQINTTVPYASTVLQGGGQYFFPFLECSILFIIFVRSCSIESSNHESNYTIS